MTNPETDPEESSMPLVAHLIELRNRLLKAILAILAVFLVLYPFANQLYAWLSGPLRAYLPEGSSMIATDVAAPFFTPLKLTLVLGVFLAMPVVLYQIWRFMAPGLYTHEKKLAFPLLGSSIILFYLGALFAYYAVFPLVFAFFTSVGPAEVTVMTDMSSYLDFVLKLLFAFGVAFEIPVAIVLLILTGATDVASLREKRPYVVVGCFVVGMLMTPPDIISQTMLAAPMWLLFEVGVLFGTVVERRRREDEPDAS